jgi:hypothetical protein
MMWNHMTPKNSLEERILGLLMGLGFGVLVGFFLRDRDTKPEPVPPR